MSLKVSEVFFSIQGEGPWVGFPTFFVRLYGCNLSCKWCDTPYAREGQNYKEMQPEEILAFWRRDYPEIPYITLTGGEPLLQDGVYKLIEKFLQRGAKVLLETNGSLSIENVPDEVLVVMDLKTPSSGMEGFNLYRNLYFLSEKDALKFVIKDKADFDWSLKKIAEFNLLSKVTCFFSPCAPFMSPQKLAELILETKKPLRLQVQLHKFLNLK